MGCSQAKQAKIFGSHQQLENSNNKRETLTKSKWKLKRTPSQAKAHFTGDGTLPLDASRELLEFREFLEEPQLLTNFGHFAKNHEDLRVLKCWADVLDFKNIDESCVEMAHSKAGYIFHRYLKANAVEVLPDSLLDFAPVHQLKLMLTDVATSEPIPRLFFDSFHHECLAYLCANMYAVYKRTGLFVASTKEWKSTVNRVTVEDFEYFGKLGQGGFGFVVECRKKSTNMRYAMKIQSKVGLLDCYADCPERVICEKQAMVACHHPFIVSMDYAFQTRTLAIMVMDLCTTGTLADALQESPDGNLSEECVRFYSAEIILALAHIHRMGLIFRDLKPDNVLLNPDGHIQLVDLGGIVDVNGKVLGYHNAMAEGGGLFAPFAGLSNEDVSSWMVDEKGIKGSDDSMKQHQRTPAIPSENYRPTFTEGDRSSSRNHVTRSDRINSSKGGGVSNGSSSGSYKVATDVTARSARAVSIMGTGGYMAPEVLTLKSCSVTKGYTASIDFWSLGVTVFKLLSGRLPFEKSDLYNFSKFSGFKDKTSPECRELLVDYETSLGQLLPIPGVSAACNDFIKNMFNIDGDSRLGSGGKKGILLIKHHEWFQDLAWNLLLQKLISPPLKPTGSCNAFVRPIRDRPDANKANDHRQHSLVGDMKEGAPFSDMIISLNKESFLTNQPNNKGQVYFSTWDFVSPGVLKREMGVEKEGAERSSSLKQSSTITTISSSQRTVTSFSEMGKSGKSPAVAPLGRVLNSIRDLSVCDEDHHNV